MAYCYPMGDWTPPTQQPPGTTGIVTPEFAKMFPAREDPRDKIIEALLAQIRLLTEALVASSPVEVIKALNGAPVPQAPPIYKDTWQGDTESRSLPEDPWGDPQIPTEKLVDHWTVPPFNPEPYQAEAPVEDPASSASNLKQPSKFRELLHQAVDQGFEDGETTAAE